MSELLGHLTARFATHPENVATEALTYVLRRSQPARVALMRMVASLTSHALGTAPAVSEFDGGIDFSSQASAEEGGIPDLVGRAADGIEKVLLEAKFWAGLTEHQPVTYLQRLSAGGCLLFVVPAVRTDFVWREVTRRAEVTANAAHSAGGGKAVAAGRAVLALVTWTTLLAVLSDAVRDDAGTLQDVEQLKGLCERMSGAGFLPLAADELTSGFWRRFGQMGRILDTVRGELVARKIATIEGARLSPSRGLLGQKLKMRGMLVHLYFDPDACAQSYPTPFWLWLPHAAREYLTPLALSSPPRLFEADGPYVALPIRTGVERPEIVADVVAACENISKLLPEPKANAVAIAAPEPVVDE
jgi:hypothetical protein